MNYDAMTVQELEQQSVKLKADIDALKAERRACARALEGHVAQEQARRDLARLGPERVKAMAQALQAHGVPSAGAVGQPGAGA